MPLTDTELQQLADLMDACATAHNQGTPLTVTGSDWEEQVPAHEAGAVLDRVAEILGIDGPTVREERLPATGPSPADEFKAHVTHQLADTVDETGHHTWIVNPGTRGD